MSRSSWLIFFNFSVDFFLILHLLLKSVTKIDFIVILIYLWDFFHLTFSFLPLFIIHAHAQIGDIFRATAELAAEYFDIWFEIERSLNIWHNFGPILHSLGLKFEVPYFYGFVKFCSTWGMKKHQSEHFYQIIDSLSAFHQNWWFYTIICI